MSYRDDLDAAHARIAELERDVERLQAKERHAFAAWWKDMGIAFVAATVMMFGFVGFVALLGLLHQPNCDQAAHDAIVKFAEVAAKEITR